MEGGKRHPHVEALLPIAGEGGLGVEVHRDLPDGDEVVEVRLRSVSPVASGAGQTAVAE